MSKIFRLIWSTVCRSFCELCICVCLTLIGAVGLASAETCSAVADGQAECTTKSGAQYVGKLKNGKPHGKGVLTMNNGNRYEGEFEDGYMEGNGKYTFKDGGYYEGEFNSTLSYWLQG